MDRCLYFLFLACLVQLSTQDLPPAPRIKVAVVEYNPYLYTYSNLHMYKYLIERAKLQDIQAKMIVFPESTLTLTKEFASPVPRPEDNVKPHSHAKYTNHRIMREISEVAKNQGMYVVINLLEREDCSGTDPCPQRGYFLYNTNVAFDKEGKVVARYRKVNVYDKDEIDEPKSKDLVTFTVDEVKFGMFTCFDILFKTPAIDLVKQGIKNLIFPSRWHGELPFLTAVQIQGGWSYANNVNLFAAGANKPGEGSSGTGIYLKNGERENVMTGEEQTILVTREVEMERLSIQNESVPLASRQFDYLADPTVHLAPGSEFKSGSCPREVGNNEFKCSFEATLKENMTSSYSYKAVAFRGKRKFGKNPDLEVFYCAVLLCINGNCTEKPPKDDFKKAFSELKITTPEMEGNKIFAIPSTLKWIDNNKEPNILDPTTFEFKSVDNNQNTKTKWEINLKDNYNGEGLMTFGIFGRIFA